MVSSRCKSSVHILGSKVVCDLSVYLHLAALKKAEVYCEFI